MNQIILQIILIALNAVFAATEIAVISLNDQKLEKMAESGNKRAKKLVNLTSQPSKFLSTIQVAITLSGFLGSAFAADNFSASLTKLIMKTGIGIPEKTLDTAHCNNPVAVLLHDNLGRACSKTCRHEKFRKTCARHIRNNFVRFKDILAYSMAAHSID